MAYEASLKAKWDTQNAFNSVRREAKEEGKEEAGYQFVKNLIEGFGFSDEQAAKAADVSLDFVQKVRLSLKKKRP